MASGPLGQRLRSEIASLVWRSPLAPVFDGYRASRELKKWASGQRRGAAPALVKRALLRSLGAAHGLADFVETGTCLGGTTYAMRNDFARIVTIELDDKLFASAKHRFRKLPQISVLHGDSASLLPEVVGRLTGPALFFLDGHYSGGITARADKDTPIMDELRAVLGDSRYQHVVVIDDARCFDGTNDYPTLTSLMSFVAQEAPVFTLSRHTDLLVLAPVRPTSLGAK